VTPFFEAALALRQGETGPRRSTSNAAAISSPSRRPRTGRACGCWAKSRPPGSPTHAAASRRSRIVRSCDGLRPGQFTLHHLQHRRMLPCIGILELSGKRSSSGRLCSADESRRWASMKDTRTLPLGGLGCNRLPPRPSSSALCPLQQVPRRRRLRGRQYRRLSDKHLSAAGSPSSMYNFHPAAHSCQTPYTPSYDR